MRRRKLDLGEEKYECTQISAVHKHGCYQTSRKGTFECFLASAKYLTDVIKIGRELWACFGPPEAVRRARKEPLGSRG